MMTLREYLKSARETQTAFARRGGWRIATVSNWCRGVTTPGIADALEVDRLTLGAVPVSAWVAPTVKGKRQASVKAAMTEGDAA